MKAMIDWDAYRRRDNAIVLEFLSSTGAALAELAILPDRVMQDFRVGIRSLNEKRHDLSDPFLVSLAKDRSELVAILRARFGDYALSVNLLRYSMRRYLEDLEKQLCEKGQTILEKANLFFNRSFDLHLGAACDTRVLYASVLVDLSEGLADAAEAIRQVRSSLSLLVTGDGTGGDAVDQNVARHLGLDDLRCDTIPLALERRALRRLSETFASLADMLHEVLAQYRHNAGSDVAMETTMLVDLLHGEATRLVSLTLSRDDQVATFELRRVTINSTLVSIDGLLTDLLGSLTVALTSYTTPRAPSKPLPAAAFRQVASALMAAGHPTAEAEAAARALKDYCHNCGLLPGEIIAGELGRVHPALTSESLKLLQKVDIDRDLSPSSAAEKERNLERSKMLMSVFQRSLAGLGLIIAVALVGLPSSGCGIKTDPRSDLEDYRPEIPFHSEPASVERDVLPAAGAKTPTPPDEKKKPKNHEQAP